MSERENQNEVVKESDTERDGEILEGASRQGLMLSVLLWQNDYFSSQVVLLSANSFH